MLMKTVALIPARSGSIGVVDKNIKSCQQLPIEYNIFDKEVGNYRFYLQECLLKYVKKFLKSLSFEVKESNNFKSIDFLELYIVFVRSHGK